MEEWLIHSIDGVLVIIFAIVMYIGYPLIKKLYGGKFTSALPYMFMGIAAFGVMPVLHLISGYVSVDLAQSMDFMFVLNSLQILGGFLFMIALYKIYQSQYITEGILEESEEGEK